MLIRKLLGVSALEMTAIGREGVLIGGLSVFGASGVDAGDFGIAGVAVSTLSPSVVPFGVGASARGNAFVGGFGGAAGADVDRVLSVNIAFGAALIEVAAEVGAREIGIGKIALAALLKMAGRPALEATLGGASKLVETGIEGAEDSAGHFHE